jgi:hypothetical protein
VTPQVLLLSAALSVAAPPATRVAVLVDDPGQGTPAVAALESKLQALGYEVVAAETSERMRKVVAPKDLLESRLPEGLSVFEADAVLAGAVAYGDAQELEGVKSLSVSMTVRLIDLGTGQATATFRADGQGVGAGGPTVLARGAEQAVRLLFEKQGLEKSLGQVGQTAGMVTLVVQGLPSREALVALQDDLRKALAGAPVREVYYSTNLGKLVLGGSKSNKAMVGPDIANLISENRRLALVVDEVANTRIVARYDRARTVNVNAMVLEPKLPRASRAQAQELGRYVATQLATFEFARASFQPGRLSRQAALQRAKKQGFDVLVESELLGSGASAALTLRVIEVSTGRPIHRQQQVVAAGGSFGAAEVLVAELRTVLPEKLGPASTLGIEGPATASPDQMQAKGEGGR